MLEQFIKQASRIFSSKKNSGKLVRSLTDRLHYYKQLLLAICIVILLGYSQFRDHFDCQAADKLDKKRLNNFCWTNGTTTLDLRIPSAQRRGSFVPHIGMNFRFNDGKYVLVNHNYMRSLWMLLILMAICSYLAQTKWSSIFNNETIRALLALPGHKELSIVQKAQEAKAYDTLMKIPAICNGSIGKRRADTLANLFEGSQLFYSIDLLSGDQNDYNHSFDYYPNQLIYLLIVARASAYKLSGLGLKSKLIVHSICSFCLTLMQFMLPWFFIGDKYTLYGIYYMQAWFRNAITQFKETFSTAHRIHKQQAPSINSIDYELSSRIWPTLTQCEYKRHGYLHMETITVQCTVSINEICAKLFAVIWWFVAINIVIELVSLLSILICSISFNTLETTFGRRFWPKSRREAKTIVTFRYEVARKIGHHLISQASKQNNLAASVRQSELSEREKKQLEAERGSVNKAFARDNKLGCDHSCRSKKQYFWCSRDIGLLLTRCLISKRSDKDEDGFREVKDDSSIYYLLYLLYLRLGKSEKNIEQVIKMTGAALKRYLDSLDNSDKLVKAISPSLDSSPQQMSSNSPVQLATNESSRVTILDVPL